MTAFDELTETIEREFYSFDVLQLVAVIEELLEDKGRIYFEVDAGLSFPPCDVGYVGIEAGGATVRLPIMNLLGSSSPLPIGFSDHITRGRRDADMYADFLSIMQNRLHALWIDAHRASTPLNDPEPSPQKDPERSRRVIPPAAEKIFKFMTGLSIDRKGFSEIALPGLWHLSNRARSAQGLKELLYAALGDIPVTIEENVGRCAAVSNARPLGAARLGKNAAAGTRFYDRTSKFRLTLGPLDSPAYKTFMPGGNGYRMVNEILSAYLNEPVICELSVTCRLCDLPKARVGGDGRGGENELGRTAALGGGGLRGGRAVGRTETVEMGAW
jgi:type VI secretion system protein ImpH